MKAMKRLAMMTLMSSFALIGTGCAAGAATAGYSLRAQEADSLSARAEQRIVDRAKRETLAELSGMSYPVSNIQPCETSIQ